MSHYHDDVSKDIGSSFAFEFLTLLANQQYADLGRMFLSEGIHASSLTIIDRAANGLEKYIGADITNGLSRAFACIARKNIVIEDVAAHQVSAGVTCVILFKDSEATVAGTICALLEHCDDESHFVRDASVQIVETAVPIVAVAEEAAPVAEEVVEVAVTEAAAPVEVEVTVPAAVEEPVAEAAPAAVEPAPTKGKKGKKPQKAAAPAVVVEAQPVEAPVVEAPVAEAPVAEVAATETPVVEEVAAPAVVEEVAPEAAPVAPAKPSGPKSWASLARKAPAPNAATVAPVKVTPPSAAPAAPIKEAEPVKEVKPAPRVQREERPPRPQVGDRLVFMTQSEVTDDEVKAALGPLAKHVVSLRNQSQNNRVFLDFSAAVSAFDELKDKTISVKEQKITFQRQKERQPQQQ